LEVHADIDDQVAQVETTQTFVNHGSRQIEARFVFPLPYESAIDQMTFMVDGKEIPGKILPAEEARRRYEEIVRRNRDPALLEWVGYGMFQTNVFPIPPGAKRTVSLHYSYLCRSFEGMTDFLFPLSTAKYSAKPLKSLNIRVSIRSSDAVKNVYSPTHDVDIERHGEDRVTVEWSEKQVLPHQDFRLLFNISRDSLAARILSYRPDRNEEGYFLLLAAPPVEPKGKPLKKTVVFVVDKSGSMSGKKIEQVKEALRFVLDNLEEGDLFNIVAYDSNVETFEPELQAFTPKTRRKATAFVDGLYAGGSTNIDAALRTALSQLHDPERANYVVFLTDGLPTTGERNEAMIVKRAIEANEVDARLFCFGVGYDVNARLLDRLARTSHGQSEYVLPNEDIEERVARFYRRIQAPVLTDCKLEVVVDDRDTASSPVSRLYPKPPFDLFAGEQLALVGRYKRSGDVVFHLSGKVNGKVQKFTFEGRFKDYDHNEQTAFVEKLWAIRRVGEILDQIDLEGKNEELIEELVALATKHGILTPYTSFLADENVPITDLTGNARLAERRLEALAQTEGYGGVMQRSGKANLQRAQAADALGSIRGFGGYAAPGAQAAPTAPALARGRGGNVPAGIAQAARAAAEEETAEAAVPATVRHVGNRVFYFRDNQWVDGTLSEARQQKPIRIKQFSDEYFELIRKNGREVAQYLVFDEPTLLDIAGQVYLIEP
ncbi:MAG: VWA domain-containing protein, partial [Planctomycetota bacterium]